MRGLLVAAVLLSTVSAGCVQETVDQRTALTVVAASDRFSLLGAVNGSGPGQVHWEHPFEVPSGTTDLAVAYTVDLTTSGATTAGQEVVVWVRKASGEERSATLGESAAGSWTFPDAGPGTWVVGYEARAEGFVSFLGAGLVAGERASDARQA